MAVTTGTIAASGTPTADLFVQVKALLEAKGWSYIHQVDAATAGSTGVMEVMKSGATTLASTTYTGQLLYFEIDDTNFRMRIHTSEVYDSSPAGAGAARVKFSVPGIRDLTTWTVTASGHAGADTFHSMQGVQSDTTNLGVNAWINVQTTNAGFAYTLAANATTLCLGTAVASVSYPCVAGAMSTASLVPSGDTLGVYLMGKAIATNNNVSWTISPSASVSGGNVRISTEPNGNTGGAFNYASSATWPASKNTPGGRIGSSHKWRPVAVVSPLYFHGCQSGGTAAFASQRSHRAAPPGIYWMSATASDTTAPLHGDTITIDGVTYYVLGPDGNGVSSIDYPPGAILLKNTSW